MAIASGPTVTTQSYALRAGNNPGDRATSSSPAVGTIATAGAANRGPETLRSLERVASVFVPAGENTTTPLGGRFDLWFDRTNYVLLLDIVSTQIGGPV
jgi:hypothetical protein